MAKISPVDPRKLIKVFERCGFSIARTKGGHVAMTRPGVARPIVIPLHGGDVRQTIILSNLAPQASPERSI